MSLPGPTKASVLSCTISGADVTGKVLKLSVYESVCKSYLTATLIIRDDNNVINNLNLQGGEPASFNFMGGDGLTYDQSLHVLSVRGEPMNNNLRSVRYEIQLIGREYFGDRANMVQQSFSNMTGTDIISAIQSRFLGSGIRIPIPSTGLLGQKNNYVISSTKPLKAINDVRKILSFAGGKGASLYFRDRFQVNLLKLEHAFSTMGSQGSFVQRNTWGSDWHNVLGAYNAILAASTSVNENQGRAGARARSAASQFERKVRDVFSTKKVFSDLVSSSGLGGVMSAVTGGHGGWQNFPIFDSTKIPKENVRDTGADHAYRAAIADGPQVTIKVPIQTGISCTVGKGVTISLIPPTGDLLDETSFERNNGSKLVADLCHTIEMGDQGAEGTTTMRLVTPPGG